MKTNFLSVVTLILFAFTTISFSANANSKQIFEITISDHGDCDKCKDGKCDGKCSKKEGEHKCTEECKKDGKCTSKSESNKKGKCTEKKSCGSKKGCGKH